jgi:hypothetical protein
MAETAAHLVDHVIPREPVRQWVLSFPIPLRLLFATHPQLLARGKGVAVRGAASRVLVRLSSWYVTEAFSEGVL